MPTLESDLLNRRVMLVEHGERLEGEIVAVWLDYMERIVCSVYVEGHLTKTEFLNDMRLQPLDTADDWPVGKVQGFNPTELEKR